MSQAQIIEQGYKYMLGETCKDCGKRFLNPDEMEYIRASGGTCFTCDDLRADAQLDQL